MPDCFIPYAWTTKQVLSAASTNSITTKEILFTNRRTYDKMNDFYRMKVKVNFAEQITMFDYLERGENNGTRKKIEMRII